MARNIWEGLGAGIIGAGNAVGSAIAQMPTKEELEKLALAKRYQEAQIKNLDADNARLEAAARGEQAKAEMDIGIKKANTARMAELSPLLAEYPGLRGAPDGAGRYSQLSDSIKPMVDSSMFGVTPKTGMGAPTAENPYDVSKFSKQATGAMEISPDLAKLRADDIRKAGLARLSPQQLAFKTGAAGSSLPADIEASKNLTKMQGDEDEWAKEQRRREEFGAELGVKRLAATKKDSDFDIKRNDKNFQQENQLRTQFDGMAKNYIDTRDYYKRIKTSIKNESPAGDLAIVYNYMKMLDPGSVVRESEFATAASTGAYGERVKAAAQKFLNGERLTDGQKKDFLQSTENLYKEQKNSFNALVSKYSTVAKNYGLDPDRVTGGILYEELPDTQTGGESGANVIKSKSGKVYNF